MELVKLLEDSWIGEIKFAVNSLNDLVKPFPELLNSRATKVNERSSSTAKTVLNLVESLTANRRSCY
jgi:hypothetical protein